MSGPKKLVPSSFAPGAPSAIPPYSTGGIAGGSAPNPILDESGQAGSPGGDMGSSLGGMGGEALGAKIGGEKEAAIGAAVGQAVGGAVLGSVLESSWNHV